MTVSGGQQRDSTRHIPVSILPKFPLEFTLGVYILWVLKNVSWSESSIKITYSRVSMPLKSSVLLLIPPSLFTTPGNHWSFNYLHIFAFSKMSYNWNYTACNLFRLVSFTYQYAFKLPLWLSVAWLLISFHHWFNIPLCGYTSTYFSTEGHLSSFQVLTVMSRAATYIPVKLFVWT